MIKIYQVNKGRKDIEKVLISDRIMPTNYIHSENRL